MKVAIVYNPTKLDKGELEAAVDEARPEGVEVLWFETEKDDPGVGMAKEAVEQGAELVAAVGGDGTVRAVAEGLRDTEVSMGIIAQGTGNLLAKNLDLPFNDLDASLETMFDGTDKTIDVGLAKWSDDAGDHDSIFLVMAGIGLDARVMDDIDEDLKKKIGRFAYFKTGLEAIWEDRTMSVQFQADDKLPEKTRAASIVAGNCGSIGDSLWLMPEARMDDGRLDTIVVRPKGFLGWAKVAWRVVVDHGLARLRKSKQPVERGRKDDSFTYGQCERMRIRPNHRVPLQLDGDTLGRVNHVEFTLDPLALKVRVGA